MSSENQRHETDSRSSTAENTSGLRFPDEFGADTEPIRLTDVSKTYGPLTALDTVSFAAAPGECHVLVGPNGSGKTTLGRVAVGLTRPSAGTVSVPNGDVGYVFQQPRFYPRLSARENLATFRRAVGDGAASREWHDRLLELLGLPQVDHQPAAELSAGFQKKLDVAIALLQRPPYLWLDEPFAALDPAAVRRLCRVLAAYVDAGGGVIVSSHMPAAFDSLLTHLTICSSGSRLETYDLDDREPGTSLPEWYQETIADAPPLRVDAEDQSIFSPW